MPKHIRRLLLILGIIAIAAIAAKVFFTASSFGVFGHYRADSVPEIAAQKSKYQGVKYCQQCHTQRVSFWTKGKHQTVKCEICHGPAIGHPAKRNLPVPSKIVVLCSSCHEALPSRPQTSIKQVIIAEHMGKQACIDCHNPHSPTHFKWDDIQESLKEMEITGG